MPMITIPAIPALAALVVILMSSWVAYFEEGLFPGMALLQIALAAVMYFCMYGMLASSIG